MKFVLFVFLVSFLLDSISYATASAEKEVKSPFSNVLRWKSESSTDLEFLEKLTKSLKKQQRKFFHSEFKKIKKMSFFGIKQVSEDELQIYINSSEIDLKIINPILGHFLVNGKKIQISISDNPQRILDQLEGISVKHKKSVISTLISETWANSASTPALITAGIGASVLTSSLDQFGKCVVIEANNSLRYKNSSDSMCMRSDKKYFDSLIYNSTRFEGFLRDITPLCQTGTSEIKLPLKGGEFITSKKSDELMSLVIPISDKNGKIRSLDCGFELGKDKVNSYECRINGSIELTRTVFDPENKIMPEEKILGGQVIHDKEFYRAVENLSHLLIPGHKCCSESSEKLRVPFCEEYLKQVRLYYSRTPPTSIIQSQPLQGVR